MSGADVIYLDHASTSPLRPEVAAAMAPFGADRFGNPSGSHQVARDARRAIDDARAEIAQLLGADEGEIIFTSGGTEADNLAIIGHLRTRTDLEGGRIVVSSIEHAAVLEPARHAATGHGIELIEAAVDARGRVDDGLVESLNSATVLVSVMAANNEIGTIQAIPTLVAQIRRRSPRAVIHTDAVQAAPWLDLADWCGSADLVSISAHKLGGPKGAGVLVARRGVALAPLLLGGGQERERRSGTHDVAGAVGLATALRLCVAERDSKTLDSHRRAEILVRAIDGIDGAEVTVTGDDVLPGLVHFSVDGLDNEELVLALDALGVCASAGSACSSGALETSHVLEALGWSPARRRSAIRCSLGWSSTDAEVAQAAELLVAAVGRLRA